VAGFSLRHADMSLNPQTNRIEFALELMVDSTPSPDAMSTWLTFYAGNVDSLAATQDWAVFMDQRIGTTALQRTFNAQLDAVDGFRRDGDAGVSWDQGFPGYHVSVNGEVVDACRCLWGLIDVDVRINLDIKLSLEGGNLRIDVWMNGETTDDLEVVCCVLTAALFFPIVGLEALARGQIGWFEYFAGLAVYPMFPLLIVAGFAKVSQINPGLPDVPGFQKDPNDDKHLFTHLSLPGFTSGGLCGPSIIPMSIAVLEPRGDGFALGGPLNLPRVVDPDIKVEATPLRYEPALYNCSGGTSAGERYETTITVTRQGGTYDFNVCDVMLFDGLNAVATKDIQKWSCPSGAFITIGIPFAAYHSGLVPVVVVTNIGGREIDLPPVPIVSDADRAKADLMARAKSISHCYAKSKRWRIEWLVDPPPEFERERVRQLWAMAGRAGEQVQSVVVSAPDGRELARADTRRDKSFKIAVFHTGPELVLEQEMPGGELSDAQISAAQSLMVIDRETEVRGQVLALDSLIVSGTRVLVVHQVDQLSFFDVGAAAGLRGLGDVDVRELSWVGRRGNQILAHEVTGQDFTLPLERAGVFGLNWTPAASDEARLVMAAVHESSHDVVRDGQFGLLRTTGARADEKAGRRYDRGLLHVDLAGISLTTRFDPKAPNSDSVSGAGVALVTPVGRGRYASMEGNRLLILATMRRRQL